MFSLWIFNTIASGARMKRRVYASIPAVQNESLMPSAPSCPYKLIQNVYHLRSLQRN